MDEEVCGDCGTDKDVEFVIDPFVQELYDQEVHRYLCKACYREAILDI